MKHQPVRQQGSEEARQHFPALVEEAAQGHSTIITRHGQPVAAIVPLKVLTATRRQGSLLSLAGTGKGLWGKNSTRFVENLRDEWSR